MRARATLMRKVLKITAITAGALFSLVLIGAGLFALQVWSREPLRTARSTTHTSFKRQDCIDCHAPIAEEWRQSYHAISLTGPYWKQVRELGYAKVFDWTRKKCVNCHAPANVLDLAEPSPGAARERRALGVECTPTLLREPRGTIPAARAADVELGVDCTSCHVSSHGIVGSGKRPSAVHETLADVRFQKPAVTSERLCGTCHSATVAAWEQSRLGRNGATCLDCHMPEITAPSVAGGPPRARRSHRFLGDKDQSMLEKGLDASLEIGPDRKAHVRIVNDRVGHLYPSGGNWVSVRLTARDDSGLTRAEVMEAFGKEEALVLDFWPFNIDRRLRFGERKEFVLALPDGHGTVEAVVRYHKWAEKRTVATFSQRY